jgi:hypothetical protein
MTDSRKERCAGEEDDETNLGVEAEFAGDEKHGRKSSPNLRRKFVGTQDVYDTSARDGGSYEWRLVMGFLDLRSARRGEHRHIYSCRVWKLFGIS